MLILQTSYFLIHPRLHPLHSILHFQLHLLNQVPHMQKHFDAGIKITAPLGAQTWHPLPRKAEHTSILGFCRNGQYQFSPIRYRHRHLATQHSFDKVHLDIDVQIIAFTLIHCIRLHADDKIKVTPWSTADTGLPFTGNANLGTIIYPSRNLHLNTLIAGYHTLTSTVGTGLAREFARSLTDRTDLRRLNIERAHASNIGLL